MHIAVLGAGALGSLFAGILSQEHQVTLIGHENPHFAAVTRDGLQIEGVDGAVVEYSVDATTAHSAAVDADLLLLTVKSYDTDTAMRDVNPYLGDTPVLTLQNGLGNAECIREYCDPDSVLVGTTTNGALIREPGLVTHTGWGESTIGRFWGPDDELVESIAAGFRSVGFETTVSTDIESALWEKVLVNVGINPTTALSRVRNGALTTTAAGTRLLEGAVTESKKVALAEGVELDRDPVTRARAVAESTATNRSSMLQDIERGSKTEIESLNGAVVERAAKHGIQTPVNQTLTDAIRLLEQSFDA